MTLQSLLDAWAKEHEMCAGLDQGSLLLCLHIARFFLDSAGHRQKFCFLDVGHCHMPLFKAENMTNTMLEFVPVMTLMLATAGHCYVCTLDTVDENAARHDTVWAY